MKRIFTVASYIVNRYEKEFGERIDEMKLHKLLYFAQRECIIRTNEPMFRERFQGWKYGPVAPTLREHYKNNSFNINVSDVDMADYKEVLDYVFSEYAHKESWSLSRLTQGEHSWKESRKGIYPITRDSFRPMKTEDIRKDAETARNRREMLTRAGY